MVAGGETVGERSDVHVVGFEGLDDKALADFAEDVALAELDFGAGCDSAVCEELDVAVSHWMEGQR